MGAVSPSSIQIDSKIGESAFVIASWTFCALALLVVTVRTAVRLRTHKAVQADDYLLFLASVCLLGSMIFIQTRYVRLYESTRRNLNLVVPPTLDDLLAAVQYEMTTDYAVTVLIWTAIFGAKFAYLVFFRRLVLRIKTLMIFWWVIFAITTVAYVLSATSAAIFCPWSDLRALRCIAGDRYSKTVLIPQITASLDVMVDVLIVILAVLILIKVKIRASQKACLALFLCLSAILAAIAIVRIAHSQLKRVNGTVTTDTPWMMFWALIEASMEICFVSLTAFRSFFVLRERKRQEEQEKRGWYGSTVRFLKLRRSDDTNKHDRLPFIPSGTMTGLKSFFQRGNFDGSRSDVAVLEKEVSSFDEESNQSKIMVTKTFHTVVQPVELNSSQHQPHVSTSYFESRSPNTTLPTFKFEISSPAPSYHTSKHHRDRSGDSV